LSNMIIWIVALSISTARYALFRQEETIFSVIANVA
jgi:hypothetical protein